MVVAWNNSDYELLSSGDFDPLTKAAKQMKTTKTK